MIRPGRPLKRMYYPGRLGVGHQWAYLPDVAETMVRLVERESELPGFARYHMDGHWDADGTRMIAAIQTVVGGSVTVKRFPWWSLPILGLFSETFRELRELRYLWQQPIRLDNSALLAVLGEEPHTDWETAVATTLDSLIRTR